MLARVFKKEVKSERTGYMQTNFYLRGEGLNGNVPIRVSYFGKPVMEPVLEKIVDPVTGKPKLDKDGKEQYQQKKDKEGNVLMQEKKDEKGEVILRDENYSVRVDVLSMFAATLGGADACEAVEVVARKVKLEDGTEVDRYFVLCRGEKIPVEVVDFSTDEREDYGYRSNCAKMRLIASKG